MFNRNRLIALFLAGALITSQSRNSFAQSTAGAGTSAEPAVADEGLPELVITPTRGEYPAEKIGRTIDVRRADTIQEQQASELPDVLQDVPGVRSFEIGGPGAPGTAPLEIRGFRTAGTQILLNGMVLKDPSAVSGTYDQFIPYLVTDEVASVEVLKGGTSALYGSDGQAGAVNIITRRPEEGQNLWGTFSGGSYQTFRENVMANYGTERGGIFASGTRIDSDGLGEHTDFRNTSFFSLADIQAVPSELTISPIFRIQNAETHLLTEPSVDQNGNLVRAQETERNNVKAQTYLLGTSVDYAATERVDSKVQFYTNQSHRNFFFDFSGMESRAFYEGDTYNVDWLNTLKVPELASQFLIGFSYEHEYTSTMSDGPETEEQRDDYAGFLHDQLEVIPDMLNLGGGVRVSKVTSIDKTISSLEGSIVFKVPVIESRLHSSIAQGYRAPTLFESDGKIVDYNTGELISVGNKHLDEEKSLSTDIGIEQPLFDGKLRPDVTLFRIDSDQTILFDFANNTHVNGGGGKTQGIETSLKFQPCRWFSLAGAYTFLDRADGLDDQRRPRTPRNWFALTPTATFGKLTLTPQLRYRSGQELAFYGSPDQVREGSATVFDSTLIYAYNQNLSFFVKGENLFDADYTEAGYRMPRISGYAGIKLALN